MSCEICNGNDWSNVYTGPVRDGKNKYIESAVDECAGCLSWRLRDPQSADNYTSTKYRESLNEPVDAAGFFKAHDHEQIWKLLAIKDEKIRNKGILDIGAGPGAFLDYVYKLSSFTGAVEPCIAYHAELQKKCEHVYSDTSEITHLYDYIFSFDTLEHVNDPISVIKQASKCLSKQGKMLFSFPDRDELYQKKLKMKDYFCTQHKWYWSMDCISNIIECAGLKEAEFYTEAEEIGQQIYVWC